MAYYNPPAVGGDRAVPVGPAQGGLGWLLPVAIALVLAGLMFAFSPLMVNGDGWEKACVLVLVETEPGSGALGSGFVFSPKGYIMTNRHVLAKGEGEPKGEIECEVVLNSGTPSKQVLPARAVDWGRGPATGPQTMANDWAVLKVESQKPLQYLPVADSGGVTRETKVVAAGFPGGFDRAASGNGPSLAVQEGIIRDLVMDQGGGVVVFDHSATVKHGNSGGPLMTADHRVIGINTAINEESAANYAIPTHRLVDVWRKYGAKSQ
ncbi:MAG: trypsin-like peptidase domain-containing protein [Armatimonadetes bacterium]|nr:trypsin-like peptidase domain-containing protein [Armatimonadota bacterium]